MGLFWHICHFFDAPHQRIRQPFRWCNLSSKRSARTTHARLVCFCRFTHQYSRTLHNCKQKRRGDQGSNAPAKKYSHILPPNILTPILSHTTHQRSLIVHTNIRTLYTPIFSHPTQLRAEKTRRSRRRCRYKKCSPTSSGKIKCSALFWLWIAKNSMTRTTCSASRRFAKKVENICICIHVYIHLFVFLYIHIYIYICIF